MANRPTIYLVGLTGAVASGKSTVLKLFRKAGFPTIDSDEIANQVIRRKRPAYKKILRLIGSSVLNHQKEIDRKKLAGLIFLPGKTPAILRKKIEKIIHPAVWDEIKALVARLARQGEKAVVIEIPLLFEVGWDRKVDLTIAVKCPEFLRKKRIKRALQMRESFQLSASKKAQLADFIIDNSLSVGNTQHQVIRLTHLIDKLASS